MHIKHLIPLTIAALLLTACGKNTENSSTEISATDLTAQAEITTSAAETTQTTAAAATTITDSTETTTVSSSANGHTDIPPAVFTTAEPASPRSTGGEGGEEHGNDPQPENFTYLFLPDSVSMRLAGGNYQTISYDFSALIDSGIEPFYYLEDLNLDGSLDLAVAEDDYSEYTFYSYFFWNAETRKFEEKPSYSLRNPVVHPDSKTVTEMYNSDENTVHVTVHEIVDGWLNQVQCYTADFHALTLKDDSGSIIAKSENADALANALLAYR